MNKKLLLTLLILPHFASAIQLNLGDSMPEPYRSVSLLKPDWHGWFSGPNRAMIEQFIRTQNPKVILEVGTWLGNSAIFMAHLLAEDGKLYAVDHWQGSIEHDTMPDAKIRLKTLYQQFLSNVVYAGMANKIVPLRMSSLEAARSISVQPDLIYLDGAHSEEDIYNDILAWYPKLNKGGILCGDDYAWGDAQIGYIKNGIERAARILGLGKPTIVENIFWYFPVKQ